MSARLHQVHPLFVKQGGVASRRQLAARGLSRHVIDHARRTGGLHDVFPGGGVVSLVPVELLAEDARLRAALLATAPSTVLAVRSAGHRASLIAHPPPTIEVASRLVLRPPRGVDLRRTVLRPGDVIIDRGLRTTTPARTLLDLAVHYHRRPLLAALAEAEFHHRLTPRDVLAVLRRGHPGSANLRAALAEHVPGFGEMRSRLERRFRLLLVAHGVPLPLRNARVGPWTVDCLYPREKYVIELDEEQHLLPHQAAVDAERDLWLRRAGYAISRFTWPQVTGPTQTDVVADVIDTLAARTW